MSVTQNRAFGGGMPAMGAAPMSPMAGQQRPLLPPNGGQYFGSGGMGPGGLNAGLPPNGIAPAQANPFQQQAPLVNNQQMNSMAPDMLPPGLPGNAAGGAIEAHGIALNRAAGGPNIVNEPRLTPSWNMRSGAHSLMKGPILSAVPGRTDAHATHVASGSYVIPADIVSGRGQGNTIAGSNVLQKMFKMGPYGSGMPAMAHGSTMPHAIKALAEGGSLDDATGEPVRVNLAGGEVVVPPENLMQVVHPDLKIAHEIMDKWILNERKNLRKTLAALPGPVKD